MITVDWVDPDTLRVTNEPTGTVRFEGGGIEVQVEIYGVNIPETFEPYIQRAVQLLTSFSITPNRIEPEPEPSDIPDLAEPYPEEPIWPDFLPLDTFEFQ